MVTCIIKDAEGNEIGSFNPAGQENLLDEAAEAGIEIPFSCHAGACTSCAAKVVSGMELFDQEKDGPKYLETDDDVVLTCIGGVKEEFVNDGEHTLEIQLIG